MAFGFGSMHRFCCDIEYFFFCVYEWHMSNWEWTAREAESIAHGAVDRLLCDTR